MTNSIHRERSPVIRKHEGLKRKLASLLGALSLAHAAAAHAETYSRDRLLESSRLLEQTPQALFDRFKELEQAFPRNVHEVTAEQSEASVVADGALQEVLFHELRERRDTFAQLAELQTIEVSLRMMQLHDEQDADSFARLAELIEQERAVLRTSLLRQAEVQPFLILQDTAAAVRNRIGEPFLSSEHQQRDAQRQRLTREFLESLSPEKRTAMTEILRGDLQFIEALQNGTDPTFSHSELVRRIDTIDLSNPTDEAQETITTFLTELSRLEGVSTAVQTRAKELLQHLQNGSSDLSQLDVFGQLYTQTRDLRLAAEQDRVERLSFAVAMSIPGIAEVIGFSPSDRDVLNDAVRHYLTLPPAKRRPTNLLVLPELHMTSSAKTNRAQSSGSFMVQVTIFSAPQQTFKEFRRATELFHQAQRAQEQIQVVLHQLRQDILETTTVITQEEQTPYVLR